MPFRCISTLKKRLCGSCVHKIQLMEIIKVFPNTRLSPFCEKRNDAFAVNIKYSSIYFQKYFHHAPPYESSLVVVWSYLIRFDTIHIMDVYI